MPIERGTDEALDAFLCRILVALTKQCGGELRIKEENIDLDTKTLLVQDFDSKTNEIVFRVNSRHAQPIWVSPRQSAWTIPFAERAQQLGIDRPERSHVPTDEELAAAERTQRLRKQTRPQGPLPTA